MREKIPVGILGATGLIGQRLLCLLNQHPIFQVAFLASMEQGDYEQVVSRKWALSAPIPKGYRTDRLDDLETARSRCRLVFSALPDAAAIGCDARYAESGIGVVSFAAAHRRSEDIPLLIPEVNASHLALIPMQQKLRNWKRGFIVAKPNCALQSFVMALTPLKYYAIDRLWVTTFQSISGAGAHGLLSHQVHDNVIPYIAGEEEKLEREPLKIWGEMENGKLTPALLPKIAVHSNRIPVLDGHLCCVSASFFNPPSIDDIIKAWEAFPSLPLPSSPKQPIHYRQEENRPQIRLDRETDKGMAITVGRLRPCPVGHFRFAALSHNTIRGGAGGAVLIAELLAAEGWLD